MKFLLTGSNFFNKGAQAMLFVAVSELRTRFPGCEILFKTDEAPVPGYAFRFFFDQAGWRFSKGGRLACRAVAKTLIYKMLNRKILGHPPSISRSVAFIRELRSVDAFIDISGYALSSQRGVQRSIAWLDQVRVARRFSVPYFVMPQSIGPFDYPEKDARRMDRRLRDILPYPAVIFAREPDGLELLQNRFHLPNARLSVDLVLQNKAIREDFIFDGAPRPPAPSVPPGAVAVIPNMRNFDYKSREQMVDTYRTVIDRLRRHGRPVVLLRHSSEDLEACRLLFDSLSDTGGVSLVDDDLDCVLFNETVAKFSYVVASRYHSIVHAFKNAVPALAVGWASKYRNLLSLFSQERFLFDVRADWTRDDLLAAVDDMEASCARESAAIAARLPALQTENCFDAISEYFSGNRP